MGQVKPQYIVNLIIESSVNPNWKKLQLVIYECMRSKFETFSEEYILEYSEEHLVTIAEELFIKEDTARQESVELNFDIKEEDDGYYIKFIDTPEIAFLKQLQADSPENFETFCSNILSKLGGIATIIGGRQDGGIDFVASDLMLNNLPSQSTMGSRIFVIGQAKRYSDGKHITETDMREFLGSCVKRIDDFKRSRPEQYGILQPTILAYWTTSDFHTDARKFAKEIGIWYLNGIALSQLAIKLNLRVSIT